MNKISNIKTLEWFEEDGVLGGQRGLMVDFVKEKVTTWEGRIRPLKDNIDEVLWVIENNIKSLKERKIKLSKKLLVTETIRTPISNGYKITEPLTEQQKINVVEKMKKMDSDVIELTDLYNFYKNGR